MKQKVINFFAGPGAGKSTTATGVFSLLKMHNVNCEYVPEYAKDLAWEGRLHDVESETIIQEQFNRMTRLIGKVDYIITDSPLLMNAAYAPHLTNECKAMFDEFLNINYFVERDKPFNPKGRMHTLEQSTKMDRKIYNLVINQGYKMHHCKGNYYGINHIVFNTLKGTETDMYINLEGHLN